MKPEIEIIIGIAVLLAFIVLVDVFARNKSVKGSVKTRLMGLLSSNFLYRLISLVLTVLILYLLYTLFFK